MRTQRKRSHPLPLQPRPSSNHHGDGVAAQRDSRPHRAWGCCKGRGRCRADREPSGKLVWRWGVCAGHRPPQPPRHWRTQDGVGCICVWIPALLAASCLTVGRTLPLSNPQVPHLSKEAVKRNKNKSLVKKTVGWGSNEIPCSAGRRRQNPTYCSLKKGNFTELISVIPYFFVETHYLHLPKGGRGERNALRYTSACPLWN